MRFRGNATIGGPVTLTTSPLIAEGSLTINGNVSGDTLAIDGCGTITLGSAHNSFNAVTQWSSCPNGTRLRLGVDDALPRGIPVDFGMTGVLDLNGFSATIASFAGFYSSNAATVELHGGTLTLTGPSSASGFYPNFLLNGPGTVNINGGDVRLYGMRPGIFIVNGGHLILSGKQEGPVTVTSGTFTMAGGSSATHVVANGGTVAAGELAPYNPTAPPPRCDNFELGPGATYVSLRTLFVSSVDLGGAKLERPWRGTLIDNQGTGAVRGTFAGLAERSVVSCWNGPGRITYAGGTGNDVVITDAVDIPALGPLALVIVAIALAGVALRATAS